MTRPLLLTRPIPGNAIGGAAKITRNSRGHFHAIVPIKTPWESVPTPKPEAERKVVALDPGVRAFQTCYSTTDGCTGRAISDLGGCIVGCIYDGSPARG